MQKLTSRTSLARVGLGYILFQMGQTTTVKYNGYG